ncbi:MULTISPECIES: TetR/AcrR family transcriptional regulator [Bacillus cereus group]|uniref:TetR/AcrR family transcriptional regulator n=1 Tax=Bacillus cereus TaxID=1396 RepID=A0A9W7Q7C5_BACCE|nr:MULTISPECIES: TetR/AcrR family transcriptional regulator [Bacillus cereus group]AND07653.1 TetR family transcriptional regulator [Bacillus thuringiensis serovar alesti]KAA6471060.1 TetR/AcrR family transcriptional regulator [Bacillus cereus]KAB2504281.1 TetR/AcrR family transcriptional regulator [Bacillus cereus]MEC3598672.1 TetR/AcrR family transcriptional regulator [Bacillus thuringiensis]MED1836500.1 TetR/AcrR family transcriptional regulator [Bacillus thuringiensis]
MLRETRKKELKELIFLKAIQLFQERGYENVTVQDITTACGIAKGTFFNYFPKKENILLFLGDSQIDLWNESLKTYKNMEHPKEKIKLVLGDLLDRFTGHGDFMKHAVFEIIKSNYLVENELKSIQQLQEGLSSIITEAKEAGTLNSQWDVNIITSTIMSTYFYTLMSPSQLHANETNAKNILYQQLDVVWGGITQK